MGWWKEFGTEDVREFGCKYTCMIVFRLIPCWFRLDLNERLYTGLFLSKYVV